MALLLQVRPANISVKEQVPYGKFRGGGVPATVLGIHECWGWVSMVVRGVGWEMGSHGSSLAGLHYFVATEAVLPTVFEGLVTQVSSTPPAPMPLNFLVSFIYCVGLFCFYKNNNFIFGDTEQSSKELKPLLTSQYQAGLLSTRPSDIRHCSPQKCCGL